MTQKRVAPVESENDLHKPGPGRPRNPELPKLPPEIEQACTPDEIARYNRFVRAFAKKYAPLDQSDMEMLMFAGIENINAVRLYAELMREKKVLTQARQSPLIQMRGILADLGARRRDRVAQEKKSGTTDETQQQMKAALEELSAA